MQWTRRMAGVALVLVTVGASAACGDGNDSADGGSTTAKDTDLTATSTSSAATSSTTEPPHVSTPAPSPDATFVPVASDEATTIIGKTIGQAKKLGFEVHQQSPFGKVGEWSLFTVEKDAKWMVFTTKNVNKQDGGDYFQLDDASQIVGGQTMPPLPDGDWYGVEGVTRNGNLTGGVMMQAHGYDREADGSFPVRKAFRINLTTLRLDEAPTAGLDVMEPCG